MQQNSHDPILSLVQEALHDMEDQTKPLSSIIQKAIRIARLRRDYDNLWQFELEMIPGISKEHMDEIEQEFKFNYSADEFNEKRIKIEQRYMRDRSEISTQNANSENGSLMAGSLPMLEQAVLNIEDNIRNATSIQEWELRVGLQRFASDFKTILSRVRHRVHQYLSKTEQELIFGKTNSDIFEQNRQYITLQLRELAPEVIEQFNAVYRRLKDGNNEARSQALLSCRRIIKALADRLYPPSGTVTSCADGKRRILDDEHYVSRLWEYIEKESKKSTSGVLLVSQAKDLGARIDAIYKLTNKGVHADVPEYEVNQCVIQTFLIVGDVLRLADRSGGK